MPSAEKDAEDEKAEGGKFDSSFLSALPEAQRLAVKKALEETSADEEDQKWVEVAWDNASAAGLSEKKKLVVEQALEDASVDGKVDVEDFKERFKTYLAAEGKYVTVTSRRDRDPEEEARAQVEFQVAATGSSSLPAGLPVEIVEVKDATMSEVPKVKYETDRKMMEASYERGDLHVLERSCTSLLDRRPDDLSVWRVLTMARLRLKCWDTALQAARRWISFDPYSVAPRNAEAVALAGCGYYGEARALFAQLAKEVEPLNERLAEEMKECVWRVDELWMDHEPGVCQFSASPATVLLGQRPPHYYLPDFADSVGPVKVAYAESMELGGGQVHERKLLLTQDVQAGDLLFVQSALVFGRIEQDGHVERLSEAMVTQGTSSPLAASLLDALLHDEGPLDEATAEEVTYRVANVPDLLEGDDVPWLDGRTWSTEPADMARHLEKTKKFVSHSTFFTGQSMAGIWPLASLARHSCVPSANHSFFGDTMIVRAARDLKEGDEVTLAFIDILQTYEERCARMAEQCGGFICRCERCERELALEDLRSPATAATSVSTSVARSASSFALAVSSDSVIELIDASEKLHKVYEESWSRITAIQAILKYKLEAKKNELLKQFQAYNSTKKKDFGSGMLGLADMWKVTREGRKLTEEEIANMKDSMPPEVEDDWVKVPKDLPPLIYGALREFEEALEACDELTKQDRLQFRATHMPYYSQALMLAQLQKDFPVQAQLLRMMIDGIAETCPGSFEHERLTTLRWTVGVQCDDPNLESLDSARYTHLEEQAEARSILPLRYGRLTKVEQEAALTRILFTPKELDENWFWDVSWCIGRAPPAPSKITEEEEDSRSEEDEEVAPPAMASSISATPVNLG